MPPAFTGNKVLKLELVKAKTMLTRVKVIFLPLFSESTDLVGAATVSRTTHGRMTVKPRMVE